MGTRYLIDTNIVIYFLGDLIPAPYNDFLSNLFDKDINISVISKIELFSRDLSSKEENAIKTFLNNAHVFPLDESIANIAAKIRRNYKLKIGDAIIAATAVENKCNLITRDVKDFGKISDLKIYNPFGEKN